MMSIKTIYQCSLKYFNVVELHCGLMLLILFCSSIGVNAENPPSPKSEIYGHITLDKNEPAIGVVVGFASIQKFTVTDANGFYRLKNIPWGDYILETSTLEAKPKSIPIKLQSTKQKFSFEIERSLIDLESVNVVGKSQSRQLKEKGYAMSIVNTDKAALSSIQADELLNRAVGIKLRHSGGVGSDITYNINGLSGNSVRIFIDGIPIRSYGSSFSLSNIPTSMIEAIEVYKGVIPTDLAEDALGGAVNIKLKQASYNNMSTSYSYGSFNTHKWDFNGDYRHDKSGFTFGGSAFYNYTDNDYKVWGDEVRVSNPETGDITHVKAKRFHDSYQSAGVNVNIGFTYKNWADRFMLELLYSDMKKDIQHAATMVVPYGNRKATQTTRLANLRYLKKDIVKNLDVSAFGSYSMGERNIIDTVPLIYNWLGQIKYKANGDPYEWNKGGGEAGKATLASNLEDNIAGRANVTYEFIPKHKVSANMFYNKFIRNMEDPLLPRMEQLLSNTRSLTKSILGVTYETNLFKEKLDLSVFYKQYRQKVELTDPTYDENDVVSTVEFNKSTYGEGYGAAGSYQITPTILLTFSGEKALRMPDNYEVLGNTSENLEIAYDLEPEQSMNLNLGAIIGSFDIGFHDFYFDVNFFYRDIKDMIQKTMPIGATEEFFHYENVGKVLSKGVDLDFKYNFKRMLFVDLNFSNFNARYNLKYDKDGHTPTEYNQRVRHTPYFTLNNNMSYIKKDILLKGSEFTANYNFSYVHEFFRHSEGLGGAGKAVIPTQLIHDIGLVYTFPKRKISLGLDLKNLMNEQAFDNWALQKPGRAFYVKLSYNIL